MIVTKRFRFEASHQLPNHPGKCKNLHGHSWVLEVSVEGEVASNTGMVIDYADISQIINPILAYPKGLDHSHLNNFLENPTSERVLRFIAGLIQEALIDKNQGAFRPVYLHRIKLYETADCWAEEVF